MIFLGSRRLRLSGSDKTTGKQGITARLLEQSPCLGALSYPKVARGIKCTELYQRIVHGKQSCNHFFLQRVVCMHYIQAEGGKLTVNPRA